MLSSCGSHSSVPSVTVHLLQSVSAVRMNGVLARSLDSMLTNSFLFLLVCVCFTPSPFTVFFFKSFVYCIELLSFNKYRKKNTKK